MVKLNNVQLRDKVYAALSDRARRHGVSVEHQAADELARAVQNPFEVIDDENLTEEELLAAIRREREEMAARGVSLTEESLKAAKAWGRP